RHGRGRGRRRRRRGRRRRRRGGGRRRGRRRAEAGHGAGAVRRDLLSDALGVDERLDGRGLAVARAAGDLVERLDELRRRLVQAAARRAVDRDVLLGRLRVAEQLLLRLLARGLEARRLALARRRRAVGQRGADLVAAVVGDRLAVRLDAGARAGLQE